jgi:hypothetical protein
VPLDSLNVVIGFTSTGWETVGENQRAQWIATTISTMGVKLSSTIVGGPAEASLINQADDFQVGRGPQELNGSDHAAGNLSSAMGSAIGAVGNGGRLEVTNKTICCRRSPKTEIRDRIDNSGLAL